jgi:hypothetical protein
MAQRRLTRSELGPCLTALRILAHSNGPRRDILIEKNIDEYLRTDPFSLARALERLRRAILYEELEGRQGEDWSVAKNYVRLLLQRMASNDAVGKTYPQHAGRCVRCLCSHRQTARTRVAHG